ncbi:hypothetical protein G7054_g6669 [Neopestalotiopsis clavispora]|nr:hypothetical protein G7054_g6669 [Neopestalotiopsis clavispora]
MVDALELYFAAKSDFPSARNYVAPLTADIVAIQRQYGFQPREIAATYVSIIHGALVNTVPTLFWCLVYVYSRPSLLVRLRAELMGSVTVEGKVGTMAVPQGRIALLDVDTVEYRCPLLLSVFRETQRLVAVGTLHRRVVEDTTISADSKAYCLRKGTSVLLPVANFHRDPSIWGPTAQEFDPDRFLEQDFPSLARDTLASDPAKTLDERNDSVRVRRTAYFPFGGGKELCPGRHFATREIMGATALFVLGFEITTPDGNAIKQPVFSPSRMTASTARPHPDANLGVRISRRKGWEDVAWEFKESRS